MVCAGWLVLVTPVEWCTISMHGLWLELPADLEETYSLKTCLNSKKLLDSLYTSFGIIAIITSLFK